MAARHPVPRRSKSAANSVRIAAALTKSTCNSSSENVDRRFGILLVVHGAVSEEHGVKIGKHAPGKFEDGGVLLNGG